MSAIFRAKPRRSVRSDLLFLALACALPVLLLSLFPAGGFRFAPSERLPDPVCAWVTLTPEEEEEALEAARTAWQMESSDMKGLRAELVSAQLPCVRPAPLVPFAARPRPAAHAFPPVRPSRIVASERAAAPAPIASGAVPSPVPAFSRDELLKIEERTFP